MKIRYKTKRFGKEILEIIGKANHFIETHIEQGLDLTVRQLYYQFIANDAFPDRWLIDIGGGQKTKNHERNYKKLVKLMTDARLAGLVSWTAIEDRTRNVLNWQSDDKPSGALERAIRDFCLNPWRDQNNRVEIWVEKEALSGVFRKVAEKRHVPLFCCRGYHSASSAWQAGQRIQQYKLDTTVLHFGDHDPSGLDMTRDIRERFETFGIKNVEIKRCALNMDQVQEFNPPPSPAKITDTRAPKYIEEFGSDSWELDAMSAAYLQGLATDEIDSLIDWDAWDAIYKEEKAGRKKLVSLKAFL